LVSIVPFLPLSLKPWPRHGPVAPHRTRQCQRRRREHSGRADLTAEPSRHPATFFLCSSTRTGRPATLPSEPTATPT
jgi:hypothetical protein